MAKLKDTNIAGDVTVTGGGTMGRDPVLPLEIATAQYVDAADGLIETKVDDHIAEVDDANPHNKMNWRGVWVAGTYEKDDVLRDGKYTMIANKQTADRPAPQTAGDPTYDMPDVPAFVEQSYVGAVQTGHEYTLTQSGWIVALEVWVPETGPNITYRIIVATSQGVGTIDNAVLTANTWTAVALEPTIAPSGEVIILTLDALNSASSSEVSGRWTRGANDNNNAPAAQSWNRNVGGLVLRVDKTDLTSTDRTADLASVVPGSTIKIESTATPGEARTWYIDGIGIDIGSAYSWTVSDVSIGPQGEPPITEDCTITITIPVAAATKYEDVVDHWLGGYPTWATVRGLKELGGTPVASDMTAFGVRMLFQPAYISPDWDLVAISAS